MQSEMNKTKALVIGAGPAGLAAAWLLARKGVNVTVVEKEKNVGGISRTLTMNGYRVDMGPHRFFTKFENVGKFWGEMLPQDYFKEEKRLTRIFYSGKFFDYPLSINSLLRNLSLYKIFQIFNSYIATKTKFLIRRKKIINFKDWISFNFGAMIYEIFFRSYGEKLWGISCEKIDSGWASQRIKGVDIKSILLSFIFKSYKKGKVRSFVESFHYPVSGAGCMYEKIKEAIKSIGGNFIMGEKIERIMTDNNRIVAVGNTNFLFEVDYLFSTMPLNELIYSMSPTSSIIQNARNLKFRSLIIAYIKIRKGNLFPDNWIYIHTPGTGMTRIQNFNNWGENMGGEIEKKSSGCDACLQCRENA